MGTPYKKLAGTMARAIAAAARSASVPSLWLLMVLASWGSVAQAASGSVTSSPAGIDCKIDCVGFFEDGASVMLTAVPDPGSYFKGWGGDCFGTGNCILNVTADKDVSVTFAAIPVSLPSCTLSASPSSIVAGNFTTLTASCNPAASSYVWSSNSGLSSAAASGMVAPTATTTYTVAGINSGGAGNTASATVTVTPASYLLTVARSGAGSGTISGNPSGIDCGATCSVSYSASSNATVRLSASAAAGSVFAGWSGDCQGTSTCVVAMNATRNVTATFKLVPFTVTPTIVNTPTTITLTTNVTFNSTDIGKQGSVFVTGWVRTSALLTLGINGSDHSALVSQTLDDPNLVGAANLHVFQGTLSDAAPPAYVLVQLTASGWQLVVNGQLLPYASGVLDSALAAQSILSNSDSSKLVGSQFCLGYGTTAAEMLISGRMVPFASIPESELISTNTGSCNVAASPPPAPYTGLFWNANESGWGMSITQQESMIFVAWYAYDAAGKPTWYVIPSCPLPAKTCTGDIYNVVGGTPLDLTWNGSAKVVTKVGSGTLAFADKDNATFNYTLNGVAAERKITRQQFASGTAAPLVDYSALWWNANESGWGVALTQQYGMIFAAIYTYDAKGKPLWYVASSCPVSSNTCAGPLYQVSGGSAPTVDWNNPKIAVTQVGTANFIFTDGSIGTMNLTINGVLISRAITRQPF